MLVQYMVPTHCSVLHNEYPVDIPPSIFIRAEFRRLGKRTLERNTESTGKATKKTLIANPQLMNGEALSHSLTRSQPQLTSNWLTTVREAV